MGYMGSGKSAVGSALAKAKSLQFIDLDDYIEKQEASSISQIFKRNGELLFRKKERFYLEQLLGEPSKAVIALGGGTPCYFDNIDYINQSENTISIYLKSNPKTLAHRLFEQKAHRPMIAHLPNLKALEEFIAKHLFERSTFYSKAQHHLVTDDRTIDDLVDQVSQFLT